MFEHTHVQSSIIHNNQKMEATQMSISKIRFIHAMDYHSALKRNEILTQATTWMNHEDIMLRERSQTQKDKYCPFTPEPVSRGPQQDGAQNTQVWGWVWSAFDSIHTGILLGRRRSQGLSSTVV